MTDEEALQEMVAKGSAIQLEDGTLASVGSAELWPEHQAMYYSEVGDGATGDQHLLVFDSMKADSNQIVFYDEAGQIIAGLAPYEEWDQIDLADAIAGWKIWNSLAWKERREYNVRFGEEWRKNYKRIVV